MKFSFKSLLTFLSLAAIILASFPQSAKAVDGFTVSLTSPSEGAVVGGSVSLVADVVSPNPVDRVEFLVDNVAIDAATSPSATGQYEVEWINTSAPETYHLLQAVAYDTNANVAYSSLVHVQTQPDTIAPANAIYMPSDGGTVPVNSLVLIRARVFDNYMVDRVEFYIDGVQTCVDTDDNPFTYYDCYWLTPKKRNVIHTITSKAFDMAGNYSLYSIQVKTH